MGHVARDAALIAAIPNIGAYAKSPFIYEAGSIALPNSQYSQLAGLLSATQKGQYLVTQAGGGIIGWLRVMGSSNIPKAIELFFQGEGFTPGGYLASIGVLELLEEYPNLFEDILDMYMCK